MYMYVLCICIMCMYYVYVLCICIMYMYYVICILYSVYVLCNVNFKKGNNICNNNKRGPGGTGGSGKLKSSKGDNPLREGRKGDPLHECCGNKRLIGCFKNVYEKTRKARPSRNLRNLVIS